MTHCGCSSKYQAKAEMMRMTKHPHGMSKVPVQNNGRSGSLFWIFREPEFSFVHETMITVMWWAVRGWMSLYAIQANHSPF